MKRFRVAVRAWFGLPPVGQKCDHCKRLVTKHNKFRSETSNRLAKMSRVINDNLTLEGRIRAQATLWVGIIKEAHLAVISALGNMLGNTRQFKRVGGGISGSTSQEPAC